MHIYRDLTNAQTTSFLFAFKEFELTIPEEYINHIHKETRKPKRPNTKLLELWLKRELKIENKDNYGNLPTDQSHVTTQPLTNRDNKALNSDVCFNMIISHVQPEPHTHKKHNKDLFHYWLDIKTNKLHSQQHIKEKELSEK